MNSTLPLALTFLTKLPWPWRGPADAAALARSMFWFPWVGALLGLGFWVAWAGLHKMLPAPAAAGLLLTLTVWVTGGLHLDGLADTADGLGGGRTPEEALTHHERLPGGRLRGHQPHPGAGPQIFPVPVASHPNPRGRSPAALPGNQPLVHGAPGLSLPLRPGEGGLGQAMTLGVSPRVLMGASLSAGGLSLLILGAPGLVLFIAAAALVWLGSLYFSAAWAASPATSWAPPTKLWRFGPGRGLDVDIMLCPGSILKIPAPIPETAVGAVREPPLRKPPEKV